MEDGYVYAKGEFLWKIQRTIVNEKSLEIRSHGDELLREVDRFLKTRPQIVNTPYISKAEIELMEQVEFLKHVLNRNRNLT